MPEDKFFAVCGLTDADLGIELNAARYTWPIGFKSEKRAKKASKIMAVVLDFLTRGSGTGVYYRVMKKAQGGAQ